VGYYVKLSLNSFSGRNRPGGSDQFLNVSMESNLIVM